MLRLVVRACVPLRSNNKVIMAVSRGFAWNSKDWMVDIPDTPEGILHFSKKLRVLEPYQALDVYSRLKEKKIFDKMPIEITNAVLLPLSRSKEQYIGDAFRLVRESIADGVDLDAHTFTMVITLCASTQFFEKAMELVAEMRKLDIIPSITAYTVLISSLCQHQQFHKASEMLADMVDRGVAPDEYFEKVMSNYPDFTEYLLTHKE